MATDLTPAQRARLTQLVAAMRAVAAPVGPLHAWWDEIIDIECVLTGRKPQLTMTPDEWIAEAERNLARHAVAFPPR